MLGKEVLVPNEPNEQGAGWAPASVDMVVKTCQLPLAAAPIYALIQPVARHYIN
jgi:hypothetical protein